MLKFIYTSKHYSSLIIRICKYLFILELKLLLNYEYSIDKCLKIKYVLVA